MFAAPTLQNVLGQGRNLSGATAITNNDELFTQPYVPREFPFNVNRVCERLDMLKREVGILGLLICLNAGALAEGMINPFETSKINNSNLQTNYKAQAVKKVTSVSFDAKDCARLVQQQPKNNVNYKPGVDAYGNQLVGAELGGGHKLKLPSTIEFPIAFNPLKGAIASRFGETTASIGKVKYDISKNTFTFNGKAMNDKAIATLASRCRSVGR